MTTHQQLCTVEEERHELQQVILDVAVALLQAQDARREVGLVLIAPQHCVAVPGEEAKLEQVLGDHRDLQGRKVSVAPAPTPTRTSPATPTSVKMMAVIQKRLLGRGMESMAHRKTSTGSTREVAEAVTMWLRTMTK